MHKIKVLHYIPGFNFGGIESRMIDVLKKIDRNKFQLDFLIFTQKDNSLIKTIESYGGTVYKIPPLKLKGLLRHYKAMKKVIILNNYDVIHTHSPLSPLLMRYAKKVGIKKRIAHSRTSDFGDVSHKYIRRILQKITVVYANKYLAVSKLAGEWFFGNEKFVVIPNSIDLESFYFDQYEREVIRSDFDISNKFIVGHVGRNTYQKNHAYLFDIFKHLQKRKTNAMLMLIGVSTNDSNLVKMAKEKGVYNSILWCGYVKNMNRFYNAMDVLILPSHYEGLPGVLLEAQATGLQCYCSDIITSEAKVTENIDYISLNQPTNAWATKVIDNIKNYVRTNQINEIKNSGFSLEATVRKIEKIYLEEYFNTN